MRARLLAYAKSVLLTTLAVCLGFVALSLIPTVHAQEAPTNAPSRGFFDTTLYAIGGSMNGIPSGSELGKIVGSSEMSQEKYIVGYSPSPDGKYAVSGINPMLGNYVAIALNTEPVSTREYIADIGASIGIPSFQKAEAQGIGYQALRPVLGIWKAFRNLAYTLYIIIFLVIGLMIMFRTKVNAQTIITIQNALPNLLITLLLITFSYAIAGFIIDLIYLSMYLLIYLLASSGLITDPADVVQKILNRNVIWLMMSGKDNIVSISSSAIAGFVKNATGGENTLAGGISGFLGKGLAWVIIGLGVLVGMIKTLWQLLQSFFMIIVLTITAPLQLLMNALPGSKSFGNWIRNLIANAAVFPVVLAILMFGAILIGPATEKFGTANGGNNVFNVAEGQGYLQSSGSGSEWVPPLLSFIAQGDDGMGANIQETFLTLLSVFIILMTPAAAQMARDALKVEPTKYTSAIGESVQGGIGLAGLAARWPQSLWRQHEANVQAQRQATLIGNALADKVEPRR